MSDGFWLFFLLGGWELAAIAFGVVGLIVIAILERFAHD